MVLGRRTRQSEWNKNPKSRREGEAVWLAVVGRIEKYCSGESNVRNTEGQRYRNQSYLLGEFMRKLHMKMSHPQGEDTSAFKTSGTRKSSVATNRAKRWQRLPPVMGFQCSASAVSYVK